MRVIDRLWIGALLCTLCLEPAALQAAGKGLPGEESLPRNAVDFTRIIVKVAETPGISSQREPPADLVRRLLDASPAAAEVSNVAELFPLPAEPPALRAFRTQGLDRFVAVKLRDASTAVAARAQLRAAAGIEIAYFAFRPSPPPVNKHDIPPRTPLFTGLQEYTLPAPHGMDADYARTQAGGDGRGVTIADNEFGWTVRHEDLPLDAGSFLWRIVGLQYFKHGTAVAGILCGINNSYGVRGIADGAVLRLAPAFNPAGDYDPAYAIQQSSDRLAPGDVILLEQQLQGPDAAICRCSSSCQDLVPVEYDPAVYAAIRYASNAGRIVVEAAGNGGVDLDSPVFRDAFNPDRYDSGALMIAAVRPEDRVGKCFSDAGRRIDLNAWGEQVVTSGYGDLFPKSKGLPPARARKQTYTALFSGTSSASALSAGTAAALQGFAKAHGGVLTPAQMRAYLRDTGTPSPSPRFGSMPNLRAAILKLSGDRGWKPPVR